MDNKSTTDIIGELLAKKEKIEQNLVSGIYNNEVKAQMKEELAFVQEQIGKMQREYADYAKYMRNAEEREHQQTVAENRAKEMAAVREEGAEFERINRPINEEQVMLDHYKKINELKKKVRSHQATIKKYGERPTNDKERHAVNQARNAIYSLEEQIRKLESKPKQDIIMDAKLRRVKYEDAKARYNGLSRGEKLQNILRGRSMKKLEEMYKDPNVDSVHIDIMYKNPDNEQGMKM